MLGVRLEPAEQDRRERLYPRPPRWRAPRATTPPSPRSSATRRTSWRPESLDERIAAADETVRRAERAGLADQALWGEVNVAVEQLEHGDVSRADAALAARGLADGARHGWFEWYLPMLLATRAQLAGDLEAGEQLARSSLELRTRHEPGATETYTVQSAMRARLDGHADDDVVASVEEHAARFPDRPVWRALLVDLLLTAGREDEARDALVPLLASGACPRTSTGSCRARRPRRRPASAPPRRPAPSARFSPRSRLLRARRPRGRHGARRARVLGVVAGARGDLAAATRHFEAAAREHEAAGANGWLAHTLADHAQILIGAGDRQGGELVDRALALARAHGLHGLTRRLEAARRRRRHRQRDRRRPLRRGTPPVRR